MYIRLSETEEKIMFAFWKVWNGVTPVKTSQIKPLIAEPCSDQTLLCLISRLEKKGMLKSKRDTADPRRNLYTPAMTHTLYASIHYNYIIDSVQGGSVPFLAAALQTNQVDMETIRQVKELIADDKSKSKKSKD